MRDLSSSIISVVVALMIIAVSYTQFRNELLGVLDISLESFEKVRIERSFGR